MTAEGVVGAVLVGGRSRRMGFPKERAVLADGRTMLDAVLTALDACCSKVVIVGGPTEKDAPNQTMKRRIQDVHPGQGPLAGLEALFDSGLARGYLVVGCDQPLLTAELLRRLLVGPEHKARFFEDAGTGEPLDPLPGFFPLSWLPEVRRALAEGRLSFRALVANMEADWVPIAEPELQLLASIDTPAALAALGTLRRPAGD